MKHIITLTVEVEAVEGRSAAEAAAEIAMGVRERHGASVGWEVTDGGRFRAGSVNENGFACEV